MDIYDSVHEPHLPHPDKQAHPDNRRPREPYYDPVLVQQLARHPHVSRVFQLGTVFVMELATSVGGGGYEDTQIAQQHIAALRDAGVYCRALGNVMYIMCAPLSSRESCHTMLTLMAHQVLSYHQS